MLRAIRLLAYAVTLAIAPIVALRTDATPIVLAGQELGSLVHGSPASRGFDFTPITNVNLTAVGMWDLGLNGIFPAYGPVGIWETSTELLLASAIVTSASPLDASVIVEGGAWRYESLAAPLALSAGTTYTLGFHIASPVDSSESLILNFPTLVVNPAVIVPNRSRATSLTPLWSSGVDLRPSRKQHALDGERAIGHSCPGTCVADSCRDGARRAHAPTPEAEALRWRSRGIWRKSIEPFLFRCSDHL